MKDDHNEGSEELKKAEDGLRKIDIRIEGQGMYQIAGVTPAGQEFIDDLVEGAENGMAYSDQTDMTMDIADGARDNGLVVAVNGREYLGDNAAGEELQL